MSDRRGAYRWLILAIASYVVVCYGFVFQTIPPLLASLIDDLAINFAQAGALMGSFALPAIIVAAPLGVLVDSIGVKQVGIATLSVFALGACIVAFADTYPHYLIGRTVCGIGAGAVLVFTPKAVAEWFEGHELGLAMGVLNVGVPLGTVAALMGLGVMAQAFGWQRVLVLSAVVAVSAVLAFGLFYRKPAETTGHENSQVTPGFGSIIADSGRDIWLLALIWALFAIGYFQYFTFATEYFLTQNYSVKTAGIYASGPMWIGMVFAPIVGAALDKWKHARLFILGGCAGVAVCMALVPLTPALLIPAIFFMGASAAAVATPVFALPPALMPAHTLGFGYGILTASFGLGSFVGAVGLGYLRDLSGRTDVVFYGMAVFMLVAVVPTLMVRTKAQAGPS